MKKVLKYYWLFAKGIRGYAAWTIVLYSLGYIVNAVYRPVALQNVVDALVTHSPRVMVTAVILIAMFPLKELFFRSGDFVNSAFESKHLLKLREAGMDTMLKHSLSFFGNTFIGSLVTKNKRFVSSAEAVFDEIAVQYMFIGIQVVGMLIVSVSISLYITAGYLLWIGICMIAIVTTFRKRLRLDGAEAAVESRVTARFADILGNISVVKRFGAGRREKAGFMDVSGEHYKALRKSWKYSNTQNVILGSCTSGLYATSILASVWLWKHGTFTSGNFVLVMTYAAGLSESMWILSRSLRKFSKAIADAEEMVEIIEQPGEIQDHPGAKDRPFVSSQLARVHFQDVSFSYGNGKMIFDKFTLDIPAGQKVAVIGQTGAGKTTLVSLLLRNIDAQSGTILVGSYDIKKAVTQDGLKALISSVSQNVEMFNRTIGENIRYVNPLAGFDQVVAAAKKARIHDFIVTLEKGYDTTVGERGVHLSGGQKQRVAIAQALLHDAPVLVLDEATSSLDNVTEKEIQTILETGLKDKTVIVIAHRLSTIKNCDRIVVLDQGVIAQDGPHEALVLDENGIYYKMLNSHSFETQPIV